MGCKVSMASVGATAGAVLVVTFTTGAVMAVRMLQRISNSVGTAPPTSAMLREEDPQKCALFRHYPKLASQLAWRSLGAVDETPIHNCQIPSKKTEGTKMKFLIKREDLISTQYGGNKVRTLQHQLAVCEAKRDAGQKAYRNLLAIGTGGSNQVVATLVHARSLGWDNFDENTVTPCWIEKDEPDLDNTLNMLSALSFPLLSTFDWGMSLGLPKAMSAIRSAWKQQESIPMQGGGNCPVAVLGQASGVLELAEQIEAEKCPDVERIYVPIGSSATVAGLIVGTILTRKLGLNALAHPDFKIVGTLVADALGALDRKLGIEKYFNFMPLTVGHSVREACSTLKELGGPDVEKEAMTFVKSNLVIVNDADLIGPYGGHSDKSREAAKWYDEHGMVTDYTTGESAKELWVCGHFVAKALQPLLEDLEKAADENSDIQYMLWMTKSAIQPRGPVDEWSKLKQSNQAVKEWAKDGQAESKFRPGQIAPDGGTPDEYRLIMTEIS